MAHREDVSRFSQRVSRFPNFYSPESINSMKVDLEKGAEFFPMMYTNNRDQFDAIVDYVSKVGNQQFQELFLGVLNAYNHRYIAGVVDIEEYRQVFGAVSMGIEHNQRGGWKIVLRRLKDKYSTLRGHEFEHLYHFPEHPELVADRRPLVATECVVVTDRQLELEMGKRKTEHLEAELKIEEEKTKRELEKTKQTQSKNEKEINLQQSNNDKEVQLKQSEEKTNQERLRQEGAIKLAKEATAQQLSKERSQLFAAFMAGKITKDEYMVLVPRPDSFTKGNVVTAASNVVVSIPTVSTPAPELPSKTSGNQEDWETQGRYRNAKKSFAKTDVMDMFDKNRLRCSFSYVKGGHKANEGSVARLWKCECGASVRFALPLGEKPRCGSVWQVQFPKSVKVQHHMDKENKPTGDALSLNFGNPCLTPV